MNTASVFFLHIPKTAGMSLRSFLIDQYAKTQVLEKYDWKSLELDDINNLHNYRLVMGHFDYRILQFLPKDYKIVTFLRDPIERTISSIQHAMRDPSFIPYPVDIKDKTLKDIIREPKIMEWFANTQVWLLAANSSREQIVADYTQRKLTSDFLPFIDDVTCDLNLALSHLKQFDFVGIVENFYQGILQMADLCGFYPPNISPLLNKKPLTQLLDINNEDIEIIAEYNLLDIELYQYAIELNACRTPIQRNACLKKYFSSRLPIAADTQLSFAPPFTGWGFYEFEQDKEARWSGPFNHSGIDIQLSHGHYKVKIKYYIEPLFATSVDVFVNGQKPNAKAWKEAGYFYYELDLNIIDENSIIEFRFNTDKTVSPSKLKGEYLQSQDIRELGFILVGINVYQQTHETNHP